MAPKRKVDSSHWWFSVTEFSEKEIQAIGHPTSDLPADFFSNRSIASLRGKMFHLRNMYAPGKRITSISILVNGEPAPVALDFDDLRRQFREQVIFQKHTLYHVRVRLDLRSATDMEQ